MPEDQETPDLIPGTVEVYRTGWEPVVYSPYPPYAMLWRLGFGMNYKHEAYVRAVAAANEISGG